MDNPSKKHVFVIDEYGRTLTKDSLKTLVSELFDKALKEQSVDAVIANGKTINDCVYLSSQIMGRDITEWEIIYLHGSKYPPVLLSDDAKTELVLRLPGFGGTSAEMLYMVLTDSGTFNEFTEHGR